MLDNLPLIVFLICFVLMFVLRMPIPTGMIAACTMYFLTDGLVDGNSFIGMITGQEGQLHLVAQKTIEAIFTNTTIIAVPLLIFAANVMNAGKITEYVFGVCKGLVGRFPGGLAHVNVLASLVFSGMTGSAVADASGLGKMEIDAMRAEGYDDGFSCAITAASAIAAMQEQFAGRLAATSLSESAGSGKAKDGRLYANVSAMGDAPFPSCLCQSMRSVTSG